MQDDENITCLHLKHAFRQYKLLEDKSRADAKAKNPNDTELWKCVKKSPREKLYLGLVK